MTVPGLRVYPAIARYDGEFFIIGGFESTNISIISESDLNKSYDASLWTESNWQYDASYGSIEAIGWNPSTVIIGSLVYLAGGEVTNAGRGRLFIYDLSTKSQIAGSTYQWELPVDAYFGCRHIVFKFLVCF